jgi:hypothetical protein
MVRPSNPTSPVGSRWEEDGEMDVAQCTLFSKCSLAFYSLFSLCFSLVLVLKLLLFVLC